jgi:hypothetical protein
MSAGSLTLTCLLLLGQVPSDVHVTNQRNNRIPFDPVAPEHRQEIREVLLFASRDQGKMWQQVAVAKPDQDGFAFYAPEDGLYWFRAAIINRQGKQEPENIYEGPPNQKMLIDSVKPIVRILSAQRLGDEIAVAWEIREENPDLNSLRLEFRAKDGQWNVVPINPSLKGEARFAPRTPATVELRMQIKDVAGNIGFAPAEVPGTVAVVANAPPNAPPANAPAHAPPGGVGLPPVNNPPTTSTAIPPPVSPQVAVPPLPDTRSPALIDGPRELSPPRPFPADRVAPPPVANPSVQQTPYVDPHTRLVASSDAPAPMAAPARKQMPPLQYINANEINLEYELTRVGPSGVGSVELWWTHNDGQSWERFAVDDHVKPNMPSGRYQRSVELSGDGLYGFILIIRSRAGMGKPNPKAGDVPEMRIEVDTTPPVVGLFAPQADPQRPGNLLLQWSAKDANLTPTPITLEWCDRPGGNWTPIATGLPNTGRHSWQLPEGLPYQVYLRVRARDAAGNEGIAVTPEPQLVDLSEPEGRLVNVTAPPRRP